MASRNGAVARLARHPRTAQVLGWLVFLVLVVFFVQMFGKANRSGGYDFTSYLASAEALRDGGDPYDTGSPFAFVYPMWPAFALIPLTFLPYWLANTVWFLLGAAALFDALRSVLEMGFPERSARWGAPGSIPLLLCCLLFLNVLQNNFLNGQINFLVLWCCVRFLRAWRTGRDGPAGMWLALAVATKIVPALLLVPVAAGRRVRLVLVAIGGTIGLCLLPVLLPGEAGVDTYRDYAERVLAGPLRGEAAWSGDRVHFSIAGAWREYGPGAGRGGSAPGHDGVAGGAAAPAVPRAVRLGIAAGVVLAIAALTIAGRRRRGDAAFPWVFATALIGILLLSPKSETHHLALLLPGAVLMTGSVLGGTGGRTPSGPGTLGWLLFLVCFVAGSKLPQTPLLFLSVLGLGIAAGGAAVRRPRAATAERALRRT